MQLTIILTVVLIGLKYLIFYKDIDEAFELRCTYIEELTRKFAEEREGEGGDQSSNSTDEGISVGHNTERNSDQPGRSAARMFIRGSSDDSGSESAWSEMFVPELKDQVRTRTIFLILKMKIDRLKFEEFRNFWWKY